MAIPMIDLDARHELVCSADPSVKLKPIPAPPQDGDSKPVAPTPAPRTPIRWMRRDDERIDLIESDATVLTVRLLNDTEQVEVTGGLQGFAAALGPSRHKALRLCLVAARDGKVTALTPQELERFRSRLPLRFWEMAGDWILDMSCGFSDPFASRA